jgi:hypothetical protein
MNLVSVLQSQLGEETISKLAGALGESPQKTAAGVSAALPTMLAGLAGSASTPDGARQLDQAVSGADSGILGNLESMLGGGGGMLEKGASMLGPLLGGGNTLSTLTNVLGKFSGMGGGSMMKIMGFLAPAVLGLLKRHKDSAGLDAGGLASMLAGQKQNIAAAMPAGLTSVLGSTAGLGSIGAMAKEAMGSAGNAASSAASYAQGAANQASGYAKGAANQAANAASSGSKWLWPVAVLVLLGLGLWWFMSSGSQTAREAAQKASDATANAAHSAANAAGNAVDVTKDAAGKAVDVTKDAGANAVQAAETAGQAVSDKASAAGNAVAGAVSTDPVGSMKDQLTSLYASTTDAVSGITSPETAAAALPKLNDLSGKLDGIQKLYDELPDSGKSTISAMAKSSNGTLQPLLDKAMTIPGVSDQIKPVVDPMMAKLNKLAGM